MINQTRDVSQVNFAFQIAICIASFLATQRVFGNVDSVYQTGDIGEIPERFVRGLPSPPKLPTEAWINKPNEERKVA